MSYAKSKKMNDETGSMSPWEDIEAINRKITIDNIINDTDIPLKSTRFTKIYINKKLPLNYEMDWIETFKELYLTPFGN